MSDNAPMKLSEKELEKLRMRNMEVQAIQNQLNVARNNFTELLELIGDRYDVDLVGGAYGVNAEGFLVETNPTQVPVEE